MPTATPALQMMQYGVHTETNEDNRGRLSRTVSDALCLLMVTVKVSNMADMLTQGRAETAGVACL